jgi:hypothetical protein
MWILKPVLKLSVGQLKNLEILLGFGKSCLFVKGMDVIWHLLLSECEIALLYQEWCMHDTQE